MSDIDIDIDIDNDNDNDNENYISEINDLDYKNEKKYFTEYILIDSIHRNIDPIVTTENTVTLGSNGIIINGDKVQITLGYNHKYIIDDQIIVKNIQYIEKTLKTHSSYASGGQIIDKYAIDIVRSLDDNKKNFMRFDVNPNIDVSTINALSSTGFSQSKSFFLNNTDDNLKYKEYDLSFDDMSVTISGFQTDDGSTEIGGIPLNLINNTHRMYLSPRELTRGTSPVQLGVRIKGITDTIDHSDNSTIKSFYIKLPKEYSGTELKKSRYNVNIVFNHYGGIPINELNAFYPITQNNINGYHVITKIYNTKIEYTLKRKGYYSPLFGNKCNISKLINVTNINTNSNNYSITLDNIYNNIISAKIINPSFPNLLKNIHDNKSYEPANNRLYWRNDDEDEIYYIEISEGNYTYNTLITEIENKIYNTPRKLKPYSSDSMFTKKQYIKVTIDEKTDIVTFKSYKEAKIIKPFIIIEPTIEPTETFDNMMYNGIFIITINLEYHNLNVDDEFIISGAIDTLGISSDILNKEHKVHSITTNSFTFLVSGVNLGDIRRNTRGGNSVVIYIPSKISLLFNYNDTLGNILGFRNIGNSTSITSYKNIITNDDKYHGEGELEIIRRNKLCISQKNPYIIIWCDELNGIKNQGIIKNIFAKIDTEQITYNPVKITYREPIRELKKLTLKYYKPDGNLIDFHNFEHSFIIELVLVLVLH